MLKNTTGAIENPKKTLPTLEVRSKSVAPSPKAPSGPPPMLNPLVLRKNPGSINTIDLSHGTIPEFYWRPVLRKPDAVPH